jgi:hypothetical protein
MAKSRFKKAETLSKAKNLLSVSSYSKNNSDIFINKEQKDFYSGKIDSVQYLNKSGSSLSIFNRKLRSLTTGKLFGEDDDYSSDLNNDDFNKLRISRSNYLFKHSLSRSYPSLQPYTEYYTKRKLNLLKDIFIENVSESGIANDLFINNNSFFTFYDNIIEHVRFGTTTFFNKNYSLNKTQCFKNSKNSIGTISLSDNFKSYLRSVNTRSQIIFYNEQGYNERNPVNIIFNTKNPFISVFEDDLLYLYSLHILADKRIFTATHEDIFKALQIFKKIDLGFFEDIFNSMYLDNNSKKFDKTATSSRVFKVLKAYNYSKHVIFKENLEFSLAYTYMYMHLILYHLIVKDLQEEDFDDQEQEQKQEQNQDQNQDQDQQDSPSSEGNANVIAKNNIQGDNNSEDITFSGKSGPSIESTKDDDDTISRTQGKGASKEDSDIDKHKFLKENQIREELKNTLNNITNSINDTFNNSNLETLIEEINDFSSKYKVLKTEGLITNNQLWADRHISLRNMNNLTKLEFVDEVSKINISERVKIPKKDFIKALTYKLFEDSIKGITSIKINDIEFLDSEFIEELHELQYLHPMFKNMMIDEVYSQTSSRSGKFNIYIDFSGSMNTQNLYMIKSIVSQLIEFKLVRDIYYFDTAIYRVLGTTPVATNNLMVSATTQGGTDLDKVILDTKKKNIKSIIFTDGQDNVGTYSENAVLIGIEDSSFYGISDKVLHKYITNNQILFFRTGLFTKPGDAASTSIKSNIHVLKHGDSLDFDNIFRKVNNNKIMLSITEDNSLEDFIGSDDVFYIPGHVPSFKNSRIKTKLGKIIPSKAWSQYVKNSKGSYLQHAAEFREFS